MLEAASRKRQTRAWATACCVIMGVTLLAHLPELTGWIAASNPIYLTSGLGIFPRPVMALPWIDPNAGVNTQALGALAARDWLGGKIPWWNPFSGVGMPLVAQAAASPLFLPFVLLLHAGNGVLHIKIVLQIVAGLATWALLRRLGCSRLAACTGGVLFALNGFFAWFAHAPIMPIAFLPMLLLGIEHASCAARANASGGWLCIIAAIAWSLLAGFPEIAYIDGLLALAWTVLRIVQAGPYRWRLAAKVAFGGVVGLLLATPQIVPFAGLLQDSGLGYHRLAVHGSVEPYVYALYLLPYVYGPIGGFQHYGWDAVGGYIGLPLVLLAASGLAAGRAVGAPQRALRWLLAGWIVVTLLKVGDVPLAATLVNLVPLVKLTIFIRLVQPTWQIACVVLAALAIDDWREGRLRRAGVALAVALVVAATAAALIAGRRIIGREWHDVAVYPVALTAMLGWAALVGTAIAVLLCARAEGRRPIVLAGVLTLDAVLMFMVPLSAIPRRQSLDLQPVAFLRAHLGLQRFYTLGPLAPNYGGMFGTASVNYNVPLSPRLWYEYAHRTLDPQADQLQLLGWYPPGPHAAVLQQNMAAFEQLGVRYVLAPAGTHPLPQAPVLTTTTTEIFELQHPAPYWQAPGCTLQPVGRETLRANCPTSTRLIRSELFFPGWHARVNGAPATIAQTSPLLQSVMLPAGTSSIRFYYRPPHAALILAAWLAGVAALASGLVFRVALRMRRWRPVTC